jgi:hypothetical protein
MNQLKTILLLTILSFSSKLLAQDSTKILPPTQLARTRTIDVKHIALDLKFDWAKKQAFGTATITFSPLNSTNKIMKNL